MGAQAYRQARLVSFQGFIRPGNVMLNINMRTNICVAQIISKSFVTIKP